MKSSHGHIIVMPSAWSISFSLLPAGAGNAYDMLLVSVSTAADDPFFWLKRTAADDLFFGGNEGG